MFDEQFEKAKEAKQKGDINKARQLFSEAIKKNPKNEFAWLELSEILSDSDKIIQCLQKVIEINPNNIIAINRLNEIKEKTKRSSSNRNSKYSQTHEKNQKRDRSSNLTNEIIIGVLGLFVGCLMGGVMLYLLKPSLFPQSEIISSAIENTYTPYPVYTQYPTYTPLPTYTPFPTQIIQSQDLKLENTDDDEVYTSVEMVGKGTGPIGTIIVDYWRLDIFDVRVEKGETETQNNILLFINLKNEGLRNDTFVALYNVILRDSKGREYSMDLGATFDAEQKYDSETGAMINPGSSEFIILAFPVISSEKSFTISKGPLADNWSGDVSFTLP